MLAAAACATALLLAAVPAAADDGAELWTDKLLPKAQPRLSKCQFRDAASGLRWDLTPLVSASHYSFAGSVSDAAQDALHNTQGIEDAHHPLGVWDGADFEGYRYVVNFCNPVRELPSACAAAVDDHPRAQDAAAWQLVLDGRGAEAGSKVTACNPLGRVSNASWAPLDARYPEAGVRLTYRDGQPCRKRPAKWTDREHDWVVVDRKIDLEFECNPDDRGSEGLIKSVTYAVASEIDMCHYRLSWPSRFGCATNARHVRTKARGGDASSMWAHGRRPHWLLNLQTALGFGCLAAAALLATQCYRHRRTARLLAPDLLRGRAAAWRALRRTMLPAPTDLLASGTIERMGGAIEEAYYDENARGVRGGAHAMKRAV